MSHAVYHFLGYVYDVRNKEPKEIISKASQMLHNYDEEHCDENNWSEHLCVVTKDGRKIPFQEGAPVEKETWTSAVHFAIRCVATDMEIMGAPKYAIGTTGSETFDKASVKDVIEAIYKEAPERLAAYYASQVGRKDMAKEGDWFDQYRAKTLAQHYHLFRESKALPFSRSIMTPYDYRAYDLAYNAEGKEGNIIIRVDYHT